MIAVAVLVESVIILNFSVMLHGTVNPGYLLTVILDLPLRYDWCRCIVSYCFELFYYLKRYMFSLVFIDHKFKNVRS